MSLSDIVIVTLITSAVTLFGIWQGRRKSDAETSEKISSAWEKLIQPYSTRIDKLEKILIERETRIEDLEKQVEVQAIQIRELKQENIVLREELELYRSKRK